MQEKINKIQRFIEMDTISQKKKKKNQTSAPLTKTKAPNN